MNDNRSPTFAWIAVLFLAAAGITLTAFYNTGARPFTRPPRAVVSPNSYFRPSLPLPSLPEPSAGRRATPCDCA